MPNDIGLEKSLICVACAFFEDGFPLAVGEVRKVSWCSLADTLLKANAVAIVATK